jgi:putative peptidoglycan lipid II flippase
LGNGIARLGGLVVAIAVAAVFGANESTDAFYLALAVTLYAFDIARIAFEGAVIPSVAMYLTQGRHVVDAFLGAAAKYWIIAAGLICVAALGVGLPLASGSPGTGAQAIRYGAALSLVLIPLGLSGLGNAVLLAEKRFFVPAVSNAARPAFAVVGLLVLPDSWGLWSLIVGYVVGGVVQLVVVITVLYHRGYRWSLEGSLKEAHAPLKLALPIVIGGLLINLNPVVDRFIVALALPASNVTIFENAFRTYGALTSLLYSSIGVVLISHWSSMYARRQYSRLARSLRGVGVISVVALLPITAVLVIGAEPIIDLVLGRGAYESADVAITASTFVMFAIGLWPFFAAGIGSRFLYATGKTFIAVTTASIAVVANLIADIVLLQWLGLQGIALATSVTYALVSLYVLYVLWTSVGGMEGRSATVDDDSS